MSDNTDAPLNLLVIREMQLLREEKRTALSTLRTGIAINLGRSGWRCISSPMRCGGGITTG